MNDKNTKDIILKAAHILFSEKGYNGVSIREIAKAADVNIAAINYHFQNKETLFRKTVEQCLSDMMSDVRKIFEEFSPISVSEFSVKLFHYFKDNSHDLKTSFKMFVIDSDVFPEFYGEEDTLIGPPGGKVLYECILSEKPNATHEDIIWAVRTLFSIIIQKALIITSNCFHEQKMFQAEEKDYIRLIERSVKVVLADI